MILYRLIAMLFNHFYDTPSSLLQEVGVRKKQIRMKMKKGKGRGNGHKSFVFPMYIKWLSERIERECKVIESERLKLAFRPTELCDKHWSGSRTEYPLR